MNLTRHPKPSILSWADGNMVCTNTSRQHAHKRCHIAFIWQHNNLCLGHSARYTDIKTIATQTCAVLLWRNHHCTTHRSTITDLFIILVGQVSTTGFSSPQTITMSVTIHQNCICTFTTLSTGPTSIHNWHIISLTSLSHNPFPSNWSVEPSKNGCQTCLVLKHSIMYLVKIRVSNVFLFYNKKGNCFTQEMFVRLYGLQSF